LKIIYQNYFFMKKLLFILIALFTLSTTIYASFPVEEKAVVNATSQSEVVASDIAFEAPVISGGPGMGIAALCCGVLGLFVPFLGILAIVFGAIGLKNEGKGMAIAGLVLGIVGVALSVIWLLLVA
jgi:hypothetical protein